MNFKHNKGKFIIQIKKILMKLKKKATFSQRVRKIVKSHDGFGVPVSLTFKNSP